jgi:hypothetical protein
MFFALLLYLFANLAASASSALYAAIFETMRSPFENLGLFATAGSIALLSGVLTFSFIILALIAIFKFYGGRDEFGPDHSENIMWARNFLFLYVIFFVVNLVLAYSVLYMFNPQVQVSIGAAIAVLQSFFFGFLFLYLVRGLAGARERDLLYTFVALTILVAIIGAVIVRIIVLTAESPFILRQTYTASSILALLDAFAGFLAFLAYHMIKKDMAAHGPDLPKDRPGFLPRSMTLAPRVREFYTNPKKAFLAITIVAIIVAAVVGATIGPITTIHVQVNTGDLGEFLDERSASLKFAGSLMEGDTEEFEVYLNTSILALQVIMYWEDEPDARLRTNQPDGFTMEVIALDMPKTTSGENPHGEGGGLDISITYNQEYIDVVLIRVTLDYAGDQEGPVGIGPSPLKIEDNSNDFDVVVMYSFQET